jgi:hypothetical protein
MFPVALYFLDGRGIFWSTQRFLDGRSIFWTTPWRDYPVSRGGLAAGPSAANQRRRHVAHYPRCVRLHDGHGQAASAAYPLAAGLQIDPRKRGRIDRQQGARARAVQGCQIGRVESPRQNESPSV